MKTILVIYTDAKVLKKKDLRAKKSYSFNTSSEVKVGDMISTDEYNTNLQVVKVLDKQFKYYNRATGEMSDEFTSTQQHEIATLELREDNHDVVYGSLIKEKE